MCLLSDKFRNTAVSKTSKSPHYIFITHYKKLTKKNKLPYLHNTQDLHSIMRLQHSCTSITNCFKGIETVHVHYKEWHTFEHTSYTKRSKEKQIGSVIKPLMLREH